MLKRILAALLCCCVLLLAGCGSAAPGKQSITVVTSIFPLYDWVRQIIGPDSDITLTLLADDGVDPHSFQPAVADLVAVKQCGLLIFGGGESDQWLADAVAEEENDDRIVLELMSLLGENAHAAEVVEGMQAEHEEDETDEHIWLSLRNAGLFCSAIADSLCQLDPQNAESYRSNLKGYLRALEALDGQYRQAAADGRTNTIVVCDRFPFRYLAEDYDLNYYAAFPGCSAETNASFETIVFLTNRVQELGCTTLLVTESSDGRVARAVAENAGLEGIEVRTLDSMQSVSAKDARSRSYLGIMEENLQALKAALGTP